MANFNTNQARHFYVAKDYKSSIANVAAAGDIAVGITADASGKETLGNDALKHLYFVYMNGDGILTRSDSIPVDGIMYVNKVAAADMNRPVLEHAITLNSNVSSLIANKRISLNVNIRNIIDDDPRSSIPVVATVKVASSVVASDIFKSLALALAKALPTFGNPKYPFFKVYLRATGVSDVEVTKATDASSLLGTYTAVVVLSPAQKWKRGVMNNAPLDLNISFGTNADVDEAWGIDTTAASSSISIPSAYALADEEWFCYGERGGEGRCDPFPNTVEPTYLIQPEKEPAVTYDVMTIQYFWQGHNENIQKSQKTIRIAAPAADMADLYEDFCTKAGLNAEATISETLEDHEDRITALEA